MKKSSQRRPVLAPWLVILCLLGAASAEAQQVEIQQPKLYGNSLDAAHKALQQYGEFDETAELVRVADIGYRLAVVAGFPDYPFTFYLIDMPEPNAFALPGGQIFVTRGMLNLGLDDDMLASLLGHEIAHVVHSHGTRMQRRATLLGVLGQVLTLGVLISADSGPENPRDPYGADYSGSRRGSLVQGTAATSMVLGELLLRNYSREYEDEADATGQRLAAAAGFDPDGARQLWELMTQRIPQSKNYGYWRTHPFSDQRTRAAKVRAEQLKIQQGSPADDYRVLTQKVLLDFAMRPDLDPEIEIFIESSALIAWPEGRHAERIRLAQLHRSRDAELVKNDIERDYGAVIREYQAAIEKVRELTPETPFLATLEGELEVLQRESAAIRPKALAVWREGVYQTPLLEVLLSNAPEAPEVPEIALTLGNAYSRVGRQADAVAQYLRAVESGPQTDAGRQALEGLRGLTPYLDELAALQQLSDQDHDETLSRLAHQRLEKLIGNFGDLASGAEYLRRYPESDHASTVRDRIETLAQNLYGEIVLYQGIGDHIKALERIQQILTHAPTSAAAGLLRDKAIVES